MLSVFGQRSKYSSSVLVEALTHTLTHMKYLESNPQEQLAYAWAMAHAAHVKVYHVSEKMLARCRDATYHLSTPEALELLSEVPQLAAC